MALWSLIRKGFSLLSTKTTLQIYFPLTNTLLYESYFEICDRLPDAKCLQCSSNAGLGTIQIVQLFSKGIK